MIVILWWHRISCEVTCQQWICHKDLFIAQWSEVLLNNTCRLTGWPANTWIARWWHQCSGVWKACTCMESLLPHHGSNKSQWHFFLFFGMTAFPAQFHDPLQKQGKDRAFSTVRQSSSSIFASDSSEKSYRTNCIQRVAAATNSGITLFFNVFDE